jgi:C1A family cysteine protease
LPKPYVGGCIRDLPDARDYKFTSTLNIALPLAVNLRTKYNTPIYDQGNLGSCTANAAAALYNTVRKIKGLADYGPSRLFIYYNTRVLQNTVNYDSGASIRLTLKAASRPSGWGAPKEALWPYNISKFTTRPPIAAYTEGQKHYITTYTSIPYTSNIAANIIAVKNAVANNKPVIIGFSVYSSFYNIGRSGIMTVPNIATEQYLGGHAVLIVGYTSNSFIIQNSWGTLWGASGYFYGPQAYFANPNYAFDAWTITSVV